MFTVEKILLGEDVFKLFICPQFNTQRCMNPLPHGRHHSAQKGDGIYDNNG